MNQKQCRSIRLNCQKGDFSFYVNQGKSVCVCIFVCLCACVCVSPANRYLLLDKPSASQLKQLQRKKLQHAELHFYFFSPLAFKASSAPSQPTFTAASKGLVMSIFSNTFLLSALQLCNLRFRGKQTELILAKSSSSKALHESKQDPTSRRSAALERRRRRRKKSPAKIGEWWRSNGIVN